MNAAESHREAVYLLHGFGARRLIMTRLARFLRRQDYEIRNWGYNTLRRTIGSHAGDLLEEVQRVADSGEFSRIHFVAHSLGSIVVRHAFCQKRPSIVGRVVMLAPPNGGSHFARAGSAVFGRLCPVLRELSSHADSYVNRLGEPHQVEIGVIAASDDWVVRRRNTHLASEQDHIVVRGDHVRLPLLRVCAQQTLSFIETGSFQHDDSCNRHSMADSATVDRQVSSRNLTR
jgi:pimeloyl-ACP methyl ester carboxylesterase